MCLGTKLNIQEVELSMFLEATKVLLKHEGSASWTLRTSWGEREMAEQIVNTSSSLTYPKVADIMQNKYLQIFLFGDRICKIWVQNIYILLQA